MLRRMLTFAIMLAVLATVLLAPASAAPRPIDRVQRNGVNYTVYEQAPSQPGGDRILYYVEDGALPGTRARTYSFAPRQNGMESAAFIAATALFLLSAFAVYKRSSLMRLLQGSTA